MSPPRLGDVKTPCQQLGGQLTGAADRSFASATRGIVVAVRITIAANAISRNVEIIARCIVFHLLSCAAARLGAGPNGSVIAG